MLPRGLFALLLPLVLAGVPAAARAQGAGGDGPPDRLPPGASLGAANLGLGTGGVSLPTSGLSLAPGFGVAVAQRPALALPPAEGSVPVAGAAAPVRLVVEAEEPGPPDRPPPGARFATGAVSLGARGLSLEPGFGAAAAPGRVSAPAVAGALLPGPRTALPVTDTPPEPDDGPPALLPPGARLDTGATVAFATTGVGFGEASLNLGSASVNAGAASADLGGFAVQEEAGGYRFTLGADVLFDFDKSDLRPEAGPILRELVAQVRGQVPRARYQVEGHTDAKGTDAYNDRLSQRRARSVRDWLVREAGVAPTRIGTLGFGERRPVAPNERPDGSDDPEGRQRNRRVEILVTPLP